MKELIIIIILRYRSMKSQILSSFLPVTPQVKLRPVASDLEGLSQNPCCP